MSLGGGQVVDVNVAEELQRGEVVGLRVAHRLVVQRRRLVVRRVRPVLAAEHRVQLLADLLHDLLGLLELGLLEQHRGHLAAQHEPGLVVRRALRQQLRRAVLQER